MDFSLTEEQREVQQLAARILGDHSDNARLRSIDSQAERFDPKLWQALADAGLLGVALEQAYGGMGYGFETLCLLLEETGRTVAAAPVLPVLVAAALPLQQFAPQALRDTWLPRVASGEVLLTAALAEPGNEDPARPTLRAVQTGAGWRLTGSKTMVPFAAGAARVLVSATTDRGLAWLVLDPHAAGVDLQLQRSTAGEPQYLLQVDDAASTELVTIGDAAREMASWLRQRVATAWCSMAVGLCDRMLRMTASYTSEREQFGVPVATFQAVAQRAADCYIDTECLRLVTQQAQYLLEQGRDATEAVTVAKLWAGNVCHRVSQASQHLHGGVGVDRDYGLFRFCLWARQIELSCGNTAQLTAQLGQGIATRYLQPVA